MSQQNNEIMIIADKVKKEINPSAYYSDDYDADSALKAAEIIFRENKNFPQCTPESKYRSVLDMMVQGLNPLKGQCSFIPYGKDLQLIREYAGSIMVAKREDTRIKDIRARVIREGEIFEMQINNGLMSISNHIPTIGSWNNPIIGAYALAVDETEKIIDMDLMSWVDIINTWRQTNLKIKGEPIVRADGSLHPASNHAKYPERMARKTVIHRLCRTIIKSSSNKKIQASVDRSDEEAVHEEPVTVIDFPSQSDITIESNPMATREHAKKIMALREAADIKTDLIKDISDFVGRDIERIRELTATEAGDYIAALKYDRIDEPQEIAKPDWG